jgi:hypothetical protein
VFPWRVSSASEAFAAHPLNIPKNLWDIEVILTVGRKFGSQFFVASQLGVPKVL